MALRNKRAYCISTIFLLFQAMTFFFFFVFEQVASLVNAIGKQLTIIERVIVLPLSPGEKSSGISASSLGAWFIKR